MSFGGEYLFPEKWKIINDTPDDGQLSKTEKIRRGEVEFHRKTYVDDDWKYHHGRARQVRDVLPHSLLGPLADPMSQRTALSTA
eukprot:COSAG02_NODE_824_length_16741_cov_16.319733_14_plen_84_part_00